MANYQSHLMLYILITFSLVTQWPVIASPAQNSKLVCEVLDVCDCPGTILKCNCTTVSASITIWSGSLFNSSSNGCTKIVLHGDNVPGGCGGFTARNVFTHGNVSTSQITIPVLPEYYGRTIRCNASVSDGSSMIGSKTINYASDALLPPINLNLTRLSSNVLVFSWTHALNYCENIAYNTIATENCGKCTFNTTFPSATCTSFKVTESISVCRFKVQAVACNEYLGRHSDSVNVSLRLPQKAVITEFKSLNDPQSELRNEILVAFENEDQFIVYEGFDGSVKYYVVSIADYVSTNSCGSANVSSSSCAKNICIHIFNILNSSCALTSNISVTVYGVNVFGKGSPNTFNIGFVTTSEGVFGNASELAVVLVVFIILLLILVQQVFKNYANLKSEMSRWLINHGLLCLHIDESKLTRLNTSAALIYEREAICACSIAALIEERLPFYDHAWGYGYCELMHSRNICPNGKVILKLSNGEYLMADLRHLFSHNIQKSHVTISRNSIKTNLPLDGIFVQSNSKEDVLISSQRFLFFAPLEEIKGHNEYHKVPEDAGDDQDLRLAVYAQQFPFCRQGFGYYEYQHGHNLTKKKKSVILEIEGKFYTGMGVRCLRSDKPSDGELYSQNCRKWARMFIHSSGFARKLVPGQHFVFSISMEVISDCYCVHIGVDGSDNTMSGLCKKMNINCYQLLCGYYQLGHEKRCIKEFTKVILMDKDNVLYTGKNVHRFLGKTKVTEFTSLPDLNGTRFSQVFVQSNEITSVLNKETYFLYCARMYEVSTYFNTFLVQGNPRLVDFARKMVPGFDLSKGFGYYQFTGSFSKLHRLLGDKDDRYPGDLITSPRLIILGKKDKKSQPYIGPGSYHCALDIVKDGKLNMDRVKSRRMLKFKKWIVYIQSASFEHTLEDGADFLYCEHKWETY